jgi:peptide/nickel transport system ATP-binding protein
MKQLSIDFPTSRKGVVHAVSDVSICRSRRAAASASSAKAGRQDHDGARGDADAGRARLRQRGGDQARLATDILNLSEEEMRRVRLRKIAYIPQGAMNSLNPVMRIENQIWDGILAHEGAVDGGASTPVRRGAGRA